MTGNQILSDAVHLSPNSRQGDAGCRDSRLDLSSENYGYRDYCKTKLYKEIRPLLVCLRAFGLFFRRTVDGGQGRSYTEPVVMWCFIVTFLLVLNVLRSFTVYRIYDKFDNVMVQKLLFTIWSSECAFKATLLIRSCFREKYIQKFFHKWDYICGNTTLDRMSLFVMKKYIVLTFLFIVFNSVVFTFMLEYFPVLEKIYLEVIWRNAVTFDNKLVVKATLSALAVFNSASSMFPVSLFVVLSCAVGKRLKSFTDELVDAIAADDFHGRIEDFRLRHQSLCVLVDLLDKIFSPMLAAIYIANIPMFCLVLYTMVTTIDIHISLVLINLFWLCFILLQLTIVSVTAAWVNVKVSIYNDVTFVVFYYSYVFKARNSVSTLQFLHSRHTL